jgi:hypothetical protein
MSWTSILIALVGVGRCHVIAYLKPRIALQYHVVRSVLALQGAGLE